MNNETQKQLIEAFEKTVAELEYALHKQGSIWMTDYDHRQALIDKNPTIVQAREAIEKEQKRAFDLANVSQRSELLDFKEWWNNLPDEADDRLYMTDETIDIYLKSNSL